MFSRAPREIRFFFERNIVTYPRRATGIRRHGGRRLKRAPHTTHETSSFSVVFFLVNQKNKRMIGLPNAKAVGDRRGQRRRSGDRSAEPNGGRDVRDDNARACLALFWCRFRSVLLLLSALSSYAWGNAMLCR